MLVDAFPEKSYTGVVTSVANIGEQLPNADAKVFEVLIKVDGSDPILRPSMTTGNKIITKTISDVTYIPLESVQAGTDSIPFVYLKNGNKQIVVLGESNENNVIVEKGLSAGAQIYLSTPLKPERFDLTGEDLIPIIKERIQMKKAEEKRLREESELARARRDENMGGPGMMGQPGSMRGQGQGRPGDSSQPRRVMRTREGQPRPQRSQQETPAQTGSATQK